MSTPSPDEYLVCYANGHADLSDAPKDGSLPQPERTKIHTTIAHLIVDHVRESGVGHVVSNPLGAEGSNDVCVISAGRISEPAIPDIIVEVRSPSDRWVEILRKVGERLNAGVRVVAVIDPVAGAVAVYRDDTIPQVLRNGDVWTLPDVLPGFSAVVERLFA